MILFSSKLISKTSSINHGLLGLLFRVLCSLEHGINLSLESMDLSLKSSLGSHVSGVDGLHFIGSSSRVRDFHIKLALAGLILIGLDGFSQLSLVSLDGLQTLSIGLVGMIKSNFKLIDISFKFLLNAESLSFSSLFCL